MYIFVTAFTENGHLLANRIFADWNPETISFRGNEALSEWTETAFARRAALVFVGAAGIAVRAIAPFVRDKLTDSPVIVMDEAGAFVIPLLSGHVGGANELAVRIAECIGAVPVVTTATDVQGVFAVDVFARKNQLVIQNREGIAKVSGKLLAGERVTMAVEGWSAEELQTAMQRSGRDLSSDIIPRSFPPEQAVDILIMTKKGLGKIAETANAGKMEYYPSALLWLKPKGYVLGAGCRKGKSREELSAFFREVCSQQGIDPDEIACVASIDCKREEPGLVEFSQKMGISFQTYDSGQLMDVPGDFTASAFVESQVGVDNVCERAALAAAGAGGVLVCRKVAQNGMTAAIAKRKWRVSFDEA